VTHPAEGPETPETMAEFLQDLRNIEDRVAKLRAENLAQCERIVLGQPPASWMPCFEEGRADV
jgi:hypothetical protein